MQRRAPRAHPVKVPPQALDLPLPALRATATASRPATSRQVVPAVRVPSPLPVRASKTDIPSDPFQP